MFYSETRVYMAILMGGVMAIVMILWMWGMYANRTANFAILGTARPVSGLSLWLVRSQVATEGFSVSVSPHVNLMTARMRR